MAESLLPGINLASFLPMHFNPLEIDALIDQHGNRCEYRRGQMCPCARIETGMGAIGCKACRGLGWIYPKQTRCETKFLDSSRTGRSRMEPSGALISGQAQVTFRLGIVPGRGDIVLPECEEHIVHEQFHRQVQQVKRNEMKSRLPPRGQDRALTFRAERLLYPDVFDVEALVWVNDNDEPVLGKQGVDYQLVNRDSSLWIKWVDGMGPKQGQGYSIRYIAQAAYMVKGSAPIFRHEGGIALPYMASLERLDKVQEADLR